MSRSVEIERIKRFKRDRSLLPYYDITIAKGMNVDRSNYSKAVKHGPITNAFLKKFYAAFGDELKEFRGMYKPVDIGEMEREIEEVVRRVEQRIEKFEKRTALLFNESLARIEALLLK